MAADTAEARHAFEQDCQALANSRIIFHYRYGNGHGLVGDIRFKMYRSALIVGLPAHCNPTNVGEGLGPKSKV
jgi:hypothetical protein